MLAPPDDVARTYERRLTTEQEISNDTDRPDINLRHSIVVSEIASIVE